MDELNMKKLVQEAADEIMNQVRSDVGMTLKECYEKQIAKKPDFEGDGYADGFLVYDTWICPCCYTHYEVDSDDYKYCPECGQRLDWSD